MFKYYLRSSLKKALLFLLRWTEANGSAEPPVVRDRGQRFWQREINISPKIVMLVSVAMFFVIILYEIGPTEGSFGLKAAGLVLFLFLILVFFVIYLRNAHAALLADSEAMALLGLIFMSALLVMQLSKLWFSPLVTPMAAFPLLVGLLLSRSLAMMVGLILSLIFGILNDFSLEYFLVSLFGTFTVVAFLPQVRNRGDISRIGAEVVVTNLLVILVIHFFGIWPLQPLSTLWRNMGLGAFGGVGASFLVLVTLPYLESFFSRTTNIKLLELADFNRPLLKRLMLEAPGTYHHALITASLAELAAEAIGDNSLLARVGAYYHDIGKLSNPEYFIENQQPHKNPHDPLTPTMSSLVVISHVKEGKALSLKSGLDNIIIDCIEQHHGTSLIHYFYHRALEQNPEIKAENFRYIGPKPKSKVTAILMIADAVEAASRTVEDPTPGRLRDTVEKVINNKFTDGQFSECPITLNDLGKIADSMVSTLSGIYHARIEYQETNGQGEREHKN